MIDKITRLLKFLDVLLLICFAILCLFRVIGFAFILAIGIGFLMLLVAIADIEANPVAALSNYFIAAAPFWLALFAYLSIRLINKYRYEKPKLALMLAALPLIVFLVTFPVWYDLFLKIW